MKRPVYFLFLIATLMTACRSGKSEDLVEMDVLPGKCFTEESFDSAQVLVSTPFNDSMIHNPRALCLIDTLLFTIDVNYNTDTLVRSYSVNTRNYLGALYVKGQGPREVLSLSNLCASADSSQFWIYDSAKQLWRGRSLSSLNKQLAFTNEDYHDISFKDTTLHDVDNVIWIDGNRFVCNRYSHYKERFCFVEKEDFSVQPVENPSLHFKDVYDDKIMSDIFSTRLAVNPDRSKVVLVGRYFDVIEVYDRQGKLLQMIKGPNDGFDFEFDVDRSINNSTLIKSPQSKRAYIAVRATSDKIYALYSGKTKKDEEHYSYARNLYVFSMDGKPLRKYQLDVPVIDFVVDEHHNMIYAASMNAEVVLFSLKK